MSCKRLKLTCEEWIDVEHALPAQDEACEYIITMKVKGWYRPSDTEVRFAAEERVAPEAKITSWRPWKDAPTFEEAVPLIQEFRKQMMEKANGSLANE